MKSYFYRSFGEERSRIEMPKYCSAGDIPGDDEEVEKDSDSVKD